MELRIVQHYTLHPKTQEILATVSVMQFKQPDGKWHDIPTVWRFDREDKPA